MPDSIIYNAFATRLMETPIREIIDELYVHKAFSYAKPLSDFLLGKYNTFENTISGAPFSGQQFLISLYHVLRGLHRLRMDRVEMSISVEEQIEGYLKWLVVRITELEDAKYFPFSQLTPGYYFGHQGMVGASSYIGILQKLSFLPEWIAYPIRANMRMNMGFYFSQPNYSVLRDLEASLEGMPFLGENSYR